MFPCALEWTYAYVFNLELYLSVTRTHIYTCSRCLKLSYKFTLQQTSCKWCINQCVYACVCVCACVGCLNTRYMGGFIVPHVNKVLLFLSLPRPLLLQPVSHNGWEVLIHTSGRYLIIWFAIPINGKSTNFQITVRDELDRKSTYQTSVAQSLKLASQYWALWPYPKPISDAAVLHFG